MSFAQCALQFVSVPPFPCAGSLGDAARHDEESKREQVTTVVFADLTIEELEAFAEQCEKELVSLKATFEECGKHYCTQNHND